MSGQNDLKDLLVAHRQGRIEEPRALRASKFQEKFHEKLHSHERQEAKDKAPESRAEDLSVVDGGADADDVIIM